MDWFYLHVVLSNEISSEEGIAQVKLEHACKGSGFKEACSKEHRFTAFINLLNHYSKFLKKGKRCNTIGH